MVKLKKSYYIALVTLIVLSPLIYTFINFFIAITPALQWVPNLQFDSSTAFKDGYGIITFIQLLFAIIIAPLLILFIGSISSFINRKSVDAQKKSLIGYSVIAIIVFLIECFYF